MKIIGIIPARYNSTRLPGKALIDIKGKPMIQRVYEQAMESHLIHELIVATDDKRILNCVESFGGQAILTSSNHKSGTDRIAEVADNISCDIVVNIQGDEPYIDYRNINSAIQPLLDDKNLNVSTLAIKFNDYIDVKDPNKVKVIFDKNNFAIYFSRFPIPYCFENEIANTNFYKHIGLYVYRKDFLLEFTQNEPSDIEMCERLEQLRILYMGEKIKIIVTNVDSHSIDTKEDLEKFL